MLSDRYKVVSVLGQGGMGAVYLAQIPNLGDKSVAIKEMRLQSGPQEPSDSAVAQFRKEATFLANLEHPNLVAVSDFFEENSCHYLVMQYVKGSTLEAMLREVGTPVPQKLALDWAEQLCSVLHYLHTRTPPILFRDLKPSNVMLDSEQRIRLIDFGIARVLDPTQGTSTFLQGIGSAGYAPLEQYDGQGTTDPRSDIYSLGATLFHLLANEAPPSPIGLVSQQLTLANLCEVNPQVSPALNELVHHMMGVRKEQRPDSVAVVWDRLKRIRAGETAVIAPDAPTVGLPSAKEGVPKSSGFPKAAAAACLVAVLGLPILAKSLTGTPTPSPSSTPVASATARPAAAVPTTPVASEEPAPTEGETVERAQTLAKPVVKPSQPKPAPPPTKVATQAKPPKTIQKAPPNPRTTPSTPKYPTAAKPSAPAYPTAKPAAPVERPPVASRPKRPKVQGPRRPRGRPSMKGPGSGPRPTRREHRERLKRHRKGR